MTSLSKSQRKYSKCIRPFSLLGDGAWGRDYSLTSYLIGELKSEHSTRQDNIDLNIHVVEMVACRFSCNSRKIIKVKYLGNMNLLISTIVKSNVKYACTCMSITMLCVYKCILVHATCTCTSTLSYYCMYRT